MTAFSTAPMHVADLQSLITREPGRPRVTWYGDDGERVELSGAVLQNWINKTVNLLVEEFDAAPGVRVLLDLPPHWRSVVWALATWRTGATLVVTSRDRASDAVGQDGDAPEAARARPGLPSGAEPVDVVVTSRPEHWAGNQAQLVAVPLPALARRYDGELPAGAIDAGSAVMTYGDQIGWVQDVDPSAVAVDPEGVPHGGLLGWAATSAPEGLHAAARVLVRGDRPLGQILAEALSTLAVDGSVVILDPDMARRDVDDPRIAQLVATERVTVAPAPQGRRTPTEESPGPAGATDVG